jgi:uncharacterized cupin superfamily protein
MRAKHVSELEAHRGTLYPGPFHARVADREKKKLGDAFGLSQFGVNLTTLGPGCMSSLRHWHTHEDELIYVLSGELVLVTDDGDQVVRAGHVVGFPGGSTDAHHLINRSSAPAQYLEVGTRLDHDSAHYPDDDLAWKQVDGEWVTTHKDGTPY